MVCTTTDLMHFLFPFFSFFLKTKPKNFMKEKYKKFKKTDKVNKNPSVGHFTKPCAKRSGKNQTFWQYNP